MNRAAERESRPDGELDGAPVQDRQRARQAETHGTDMRVGGRAEARAAAAEELALCLQLRVNLETDDGLVRHADAGVLRADCNRPSIRLPATSYQLPANHQLPATGFRLSASRCRLSDFSARLSQGLQHPPEGIDDERIEL